MARPIRVEYEGASYHVTARGNERKLIYRSDEDYKLFLRTLMQMVRRYGVDLEAYCLMPNHYHLAITTPRGNLVQAAGWLQTTYTIRFNKRHKRSGHLFQGRYKAQIVGGAEYAKELVKYIHLNPVRPRDKKAKIPEWKIKELEQYKWSSHVYYAGRQQAEEWVKMEWLDLWGKSRRAATEVYRREIAEYFGKPVKSIWGQLKGGLVLGENKEYDKVKAIIAEQAKSDELKWIARERQSDVQRQMGKLIKEEDDERIKIWMRVRIGGERMAEVGRELGYADGSGIHRVVNRLEDLATRDKILKQKMERIYKLSSVKS